MSNKNTIVDGEGGDHSELNVQKMDKLHSVGDITTANCNVVRSGIMYSTFMIH